MTVDGVPSSVTAVEIEYCVPCGYLDRAVEIQRALLRQFGLELDSVALVTGRDGVLAVRVDGETVFDRFEDEYDPDEVTRRVRGYVGRG